MHIYHEIEYYHDTRKMEHQNEQVFKVLVYKKVMMVDPCLILCFGEKWKTIEIVKEMILLLIQFIERNSLNYIENTVD